MARRSSQGMRQAESQLESRRRQAEDRLDDVRQALGREIGWVPRGKTWVLPLVAFAFGLAVAGTKMIRRARSEKPERDERPETLSTSEPSTSPTSPTRPTSPTIPAGNGRSAPPSRRSAS